MPAAERRTLSASVNPKHAPAARVDDHRQLSPARRMAPVETQMLRCALLSSLCLHAPPSARPRCNQITRTERLTPARPSLPPRVPQITVEDEDDLPPRPPRKKKNPEGPLGYGPGEAPPDAPPIPDPHLSPEEHDAAFLAHLGPPKHMPGARLDNSFAGYVLAATIGTLFEQASYVGNTNKERADKAKMDQTYRDVGELYHTECLRNKLSKADPATLTGIPKGEELLDGAHFDMYSYAQFKVSAPPRLPPPPVPGP